MVGTATSGAQSPELLDDVAPPAVPFQYFWGDISGHRFESQPKEFLSDGQPVPFTNECGVCHKGDLPLPLGPGGIGSVTGTLLKVSVTAR